MTEPRANDLFDLERFVAAQRDSYATALQELQHGEKGSHWMWYVFPQVAGLGHSSMAQRYAIKSRGEGAAYLAHSVLGPRLNECAVALLNVQGKTAEEIMGSPDCLKLRSSMTLFAKCAGPDSLFQKVLDKYFGGEMDQRTIDYLRADETSSSLPA